MKHNHLVLRNNFLSDFDHLFDGFLSSQGSDSRSPHFYDSDTAYLVSFDVPGIKKQDLEIEFKDQLLHVSGESKIQGPKEYTRSFKRSLRVPKDADENKIEAHLEDGILQIAIAKKEETPGRKIEVSSEKENLFSRFLGSKQ